LSGYLIPTTNHTKESIITPIRKTIRAGPNPFLRVAKMGAALKRSKGLQQQYHNYRRLVKKEIEPAKLRHRSAFRVRVNEQIDCEQFDFVLVRAQFFNIIVGSQTRTKIA
jgi:hypothetical protein